MARVLVLTLVFPPDGVSTARIVGSLAEELERHGHDVMVVTTTPHYNVDVEAQARQELEPRWGRFLQTSTIAGIPVLHVLMPRKQRSAVLRVAGWLWFHTVSTIAALLALPARPDVVLAPSPPLTMGVSAWLLAARWRVPYIYNVQEVHPDILVSLGMIRPGLLLRILQRLERFVYRHAAAVTVVAPSAEQRLLHKGVPAHRVCVVPNFVDMEGLAAERRPNAFSLAHRLDGHFVVTYAGNFGPAQHLDTILDAARLLAGDPRVRFVLAGGGTDWERVARAAAGLSNVYVLPYQPYSSMPAVHGATDLALVPLAAGTGLDAIPSKVFEVMGCGLPVLAIADADSDLARLVEKAGGGVVVPPGSAEAVAETVRAAVNDPDRWRGLGRSGRAHVARHYSRRSVAESYDAIVRRLTVSQSPV